MFETSSAQLHKHYITYKCTIAVSYLKCTQIIAIYIRGMIEKFGDNTYFELTDDQ